MIFSADHRWSFWWIGAVTLALAVIHQNTQITFSWRHQKNPKFLLFFLNFDIFCITYQNTSIDVYPIRVCSQTGGVALPLEFGAEVTTVPDSQEWTPGTECDRNMGSCCQSLPRWWWQWWCHTDSQHPAENRNRQLSKMFFVKDHNKGRNK